MKRHRLVITLFLFLIAGAATAQRTRPKDLSDSALLDLTEKQTFRYFWDYAHPVSGMARERSNKTFDYGDEVVTTGGTGFGVMAIIAATERKYIGRDTAAKFLLKMVLFLQKANSYHGAFPHWMNGETGKTITVPVIDDADQESDEFFFVNLSGAANAGYADSQGDATILDDDPPLVSVNDVSVTEGDGGNVTATFTVFLSKPGTTSVWLDWATAAGTATAGVDYTGGSGTVVFSPGQTGKDQDQEEPPGRTDGWAAIHARLSNLGSILESSRRPLEGPGPSTIASDPAQGAFSDSLRNNRERKIC